MKSPRRIAFITDVEGNFEYLKKAVHLNPTLNLTNHSQIEFNDNPNSEFVFGGDACDRGDDKRVLLTLLNFKKKYNKRVHLIIGNRDSCKLRIRKELHQPRCSNIFWTKPQLTWKQFVENLQRKPTKRDKLSWILKYTMGAPEALNHRDNYSPDGVVSLVREITPPNGLLWTYLKKSKIATKIDCVLFLHGAICYENICKTPLLEETLTPPKSSIQYHKSRSIISWIRKLHEFKTYNLKCYENDYRKGQNLVGYGYSNTMKNGTVMTTSFINKGMPADINSDVIDCCIQSGVKIIVVGHHPHGDSPAVRRTPCGKLIIISADTSFSSPSSSDKRGVAVAAVTVLPDSSDVKIEGILSDGTFYSFNVSDHPIVGQLVHYKGNTWWCKTALSKNRYLIARPVCDLGHSLQYKRVKSSDLILFE